MKPEIKTDATARINRIVGQANGIKRMIEEDKYCVSILDQIAAVRSALDQLGVQLLTGHLESCVLGADEGGRSAARSQTDLLEEVRVTLSRFLK